MESQLTLLGIAGEAEIQSREWPSSGVFDQVLLLITGCLWGTCPLRLSLDIGGVPMGIAGEALWNGPWV